MNVLPTLYALAFQAEDLARRSGGHGLLHGIGRIILFLVVVLIVIGVLIGVVISRLFRRRPPR